MGLKVLLKALGDKRIALLNHKIGGYVLNYAAAYLPLCVVKLLVESGADVLLANPNKVNPAEKYGFALQNKKPSIGTVEIQNYLDQKLKKSVGFMPKSILKNSQDDDVKKIPSSKRVSFSGKIKVKKIPHKKKSKKVVQTEVQEESDTESTLGPGKAPEPSKIAPSKE